MNFQELYRRIEALDRPVNEEPNEGNAFSGALDAAKDAGQDEFDVDGKTFQVKEDDVEECGMDMPSMASKQPDNVSMNLSMNGSGAGGIKDLLDILRNIENSDDSEGDDLGDLIGQMDSPSSGKKDVIVGDSIDGEFSNATTEPNPEYKDTDYMTKDISGGFGTQQTMHPHGYQNADNPLAMETLKSKLSNLYQEVKLRESSGEQLDEFDVKLYQPHNLEFNNLPTRPPEVEAVIKTMKPADYIMYNKYIQTNPGPKLGDEDFMRWNSLGVSYKRQDQYNFVQRYNRDNNNLSIAQWIEKGKNAIKGAVTGKPAEPVSYQASRDTFSSAPTTAEKEFPMKESNEIVALSKMLNS